TRYWVLVGSSPVGYDIYNSGNITVRSLTVNNIPTDGRTMYVTPNSYVNNACDYNEYTYTAFHSIATPTPTPSPSPTPSSTPTPTPTPTPTATPTPSPTATPTPTPTPAAPTNLTATAGSATQVNLSWTVNSTNQTGFKIERSGDGTTFAQIATVGANVSTYS